MISAPGCSGLSKYAAELYRRDAFTICHVHTPNSSTTSKVQYTLRILDRREVETVIEQNQEHMVCNVKLIILNLIIWSPVLAFSEFVVPSTILVAMFPDSGRDRSCIAQMIRVSICGI